MIYEDELINRISQCCKETLDPIQYEQWVDIEISLRKYRKNMNETWIDVKEAKEGIVYYAQMINCNNEITNSLCMLDNEKVWWTHSGEDTIETLDSYDYGLKVLNCHTLPSLESIELKKCDDCGKCKKDVVDTVCPFAEEINNSEVKCTLCDDCYHERSMDI